MIKKMLILCLSLLISGCGFQTVDMAKHPLHLQIDMQPEDIMLQRALTRYSDPKGQPLILRIRSNKHIAPLNGMTHQQSMLAYTLTYQSDLTINHQAKKTFSVDTQLILPVNQSIEEQTQARKAWQHLADDLATAIFLHIQQFIRFSLTTHK